MKPIQKGMTTAVTRGELEAAKREGRAPVADVTQLTWFDVDTKDVPCIAGVFGNHLETWYENGTYKYNSLAKQDIFALPEYEYQWIVQYDDGSFDMTSYYKTKEEAAYEYSAKVIEPYEPSKREVELI